VCWLPYPGDRCRLCLGALARRHAPVLRGDGHGWAVLGQGSAWPAQAVRSSVPVQPGLLSPGDGHPLALPGAAIPSGMMSFPRWLWHRPLGHGCWPGHKERTVWAGRDGQMGSQGGRKGAAFKPLLFPFLATNQHLARSWSCTGTATTP